MTRIRTYCSTVLVALALATTLLGFRLTAHAAGRARTIPHTTCQGSDLYSYEETVSQQTIAPDGITLTIALYAQVSQASISNPPIIYCGQLNPIVKVTQQANKPQDIIDLEIVQKIEVPGGQATTYPVPPISANSEPGNTFVLGNGGWQTLAEQDIDCTSYYMWWTHVQVKQPTHEYDYYQPQPYGQSVNGGDGWCWQQSECQTVGDPRLTPNSGGSTLEVTHPTYITNYYGVNLTVSAYAWTYHGTYCGFMDPYTAMAQPYGEPQLLNIPCVINLTDDVTGTNPWTPTGLGNTNPGHTSYCGTGWWWHVPLGVITCGPPPLSNHYMWANTDFSYYNGFQYGSDGWCF